MEKDINKYEFSHRYGNLIYSFDKKLLEMLIADGKFLRKKIFLFLPLVLLLILMTFFTIITFFNVKLVLHPIRATPWYTILTYMFVNDSWVMFIISALTTVVLWAFLIRNFHWFTIFSVFVLGGFLTGITSATGLAGSSTSLSGSAPGVFALASMLMITAQNKAEILAPMGLITSLMVYTGLFPEQSFINLSHFTGLFWGGVVFLIFVHKEARNYYRINFINIFFMFSIVLFLLFNIKWFYSGVWHVIAGLILLGIVVLALKLLLNKSRKGKLVLEGVRLIELLEKAGGILRVEYSNSEKEPGIKEDIGILRRTFRSIFRKTKKGYTENFG